MDVYKITDRIERIAREKENLDYGEIIYIREYDTICLELEYLESGIKKLLKENGFCLDVFENERGKLVYSEFNR